MNEQFEKMEHTLESFVSPTENNDWVNKFDKLFHLVSDELNPIEEQIFELMVKKNEIFDKVQELRQELIKNCIHPQGNVEYSEDGIHAECKFCQKKFRIIT